MKEFIAGQFGNFLTDLETIVNIDSGSTDLHGVRAVAAFFQRRFDALGMTTELVGLGERGVPCLKAYTSPRNNRFDLMMIGHMDTVFPQGEAEKRPFAIVDNRATGPGVCDMKGGLLTALYALEALNNDGLLDKLSVCVTFNGDEEVGSPDSREWIETNGRLCDRVFVFEPCKKGYRYILERSGGGAILVTAKGVASHAGGAPEKGANAVLEIAHQILNMHSLNDPEKKTSVHATVISGGRKVNIVPDHARVSVDVRVRQMSELPRIKAFFDALPSKPYVNGVSLSVNSEIDRPPMVPDASTMKLWRIIKDVAKAVDIIPEHAPRGGCSDGNFTSALGIPTIDGMGASGENSHTADEYLDLTSIVPLTTIVALACKEIVLKHTPGAKAG